MLQVLFSQPQFYGTFIYLFIVHSYEILHTFIWGFSVPADTLKDYLLVNTFLTILLKRQEEEIRKQQIHK
jgi:hypothetical protein